MGYLPLLRRGGADALPQHRALHLNQGTLLAALVGESDDPAGIGICHDLGALERGAFARGTLAGWEASASLLLPASRLDRSVSPKQTAHSLARACCSPTKEVRSCGEVAPPLR